MSDPKSSYGEPVDEPEEVPADADVVGRANEGLAVAEAARRDPEASGADENAAVDSAGGTADAAVSEDEVAAVPADGEAVVVEETVVEESSEREIPWYERDDVPLDDEPAVTPSEPVQDATPAAAAPAPSYPTEQQAPAATQEYTAQQAQPIFVQAPEAPRPRGNRGAAGAIGLLAAVAFAVLYLAAWLAIDLLRGELALSDLPTAALSALATAALWVPVVVFFLAFWLLGAFINRGGWGHWVIWGLLVGVAAWAGHVLGQFFQAPFWMLTARQGAELLEAQVLAPLAIVAFVLGRELTVWFGAWVAARGRRVTELNAEAQREYERTLEAGPQLVRA